MNAYLAQNEDHTRTAIIIATDDDTAVLVLNGAYSAHDVLEALPNIESIEVIDEHTSIG